MFARYEPPGASRASTGTSRLKKKLSAWAVALSLAVSMDSGAHAKPKPVLPDPEALVCPKAQGDLEYAIYKVMTEAKFQEWAGSLSWRRRQDGPFHLLSMEPAQYFHAEFETFSTSEGTRLIAGLRWRTSKYEFGVREPEIVNAFRKVLDGLEAAFPCPNSNR